MLETFLIWDTSEKSVSEEELKNIIEAQVRKEDDHVIVAYTKFDFPEGCYWSLIGDIASKEICDGRKGLNEFKNIHLERWTRFCDEALRDDNTYIKVMIDKLGIPVKVVMRND